MAQTAAPRRQQAEERREQILDAAIRAFSEKGFAGASVRDIAGSIGVTEGLLYHYFESKEALMHACWKERTWRAHLERILAGAEGLPVEQVLRELVTDLMRTLRQNGEMVRMCAGESQRSPELAAWHRERIQENQRLIDEFLHARAARGEIRADAHMETAAGLLMGCAYSCFLLLGSLDDDIWNNAVESLAQNGVDIVMRGLTPR